MEDFTFETVKMVIRAIRFRDQDRLNNDILMKLKQPYLEMEDYTFETAKRVIMVDRFRDQN